MLGVFTEEYREGNLAVRETTVTFLCIPIFMYKKVSTNNKAVAVLTPASKATEVIGFVNNEEDKT